MSNNEKDLSDLYRALGYAFRDESVIRNALTHSSYCYEHRLDYRENNERLEFLGDAIFDAVIADELYLRLTDREEGDLSRLRASIICAWDTGNSCPQAAGKNVLSQRMRWKLPSAPSISMAAGRTQKR